MRIKTKRRFFWTALIGFFCWMLGSYLYHFQLHASLRQDAISDFETAFQEKSNDLYEALLLFVDDYPETKPLDNRFGYAVNRMNETGFNYYVFVNDTLDLWTNNKVVHPG